MKDLEKGLYEKCGKYDFGELVAEELKKRGIMISNDSLLYKFVEKAKRENIEVYVVNRKSIPDIIRCSLIINNKLVEVPKSEEAIQEYTEKVRKECIERYLGECEEVAKNSVFDILKYYIIFPSFNFFRGKVNVKVPDVDALTSLLTYSFPFGTVEGKNNIILYLSEETLDQLLPLLLHEQFHLIRNHYLSLNLDLELKLYFEILEPYIISNNSLRNKLKESRTPYVGEIATEYVSLLILEELGDKGIELINRRKDIIENSLREITEKTEIVGRGGTTLPYARRDTLVAYLFAHELLKYGEIKEKVIEFLRNIFNIA